MASFILSLATKNTIAVGFSDPHGLPSLSTRGFPTHSNLARSISYTISKIRLLKYWSDQNLTHPTDWEVIDLT